MSGSLLMVADFSRASTVRVTLELQLSTVVIEALVRLPFVLIL